MSSASIREPAVTTFQQRSLKNKNVRSAVDLPTQLDTQTEHHTVNTTVRGDRRIQVAFTSPPVGSCGNGSVGDDICADGRCCSEFGWCGTGVEFCGPTSSPTGSGTLTPTLSVLGTFPPTSPPSGSTLPPSGSDTPAPTQNSFSPSPVTNPTPTPPMPTPPSSTPPSPSGGGSAAKYLALSVVPLLIIGVVYFVYLMRKKKKNHGPNNNEESGNSDFSLEQVGETPRNPQTGVSRSPYHHAHNHRNAKPVTDPPVTGSTLSSEESNHTSKTESASQEAQGDGLHGSRHNYAAPQFITSRNAKPHASPVPGPQGYTVSNKDQCRTVLAEEIMVTAVPIESDFDDHRNCAQLDP